MEKKSRKGAGSSNLQSIIEQLDNGVKDLFESEKYENYLRTIAKFHKYSINNTILIASQMPNATLVAGFNSWKNDFSRYVKKGERGIKILAPIKCKTKVMQNCVDQDGNPILDKNDKPLQKKTEIERMSFQVATVFDISQTEGKDLPRLGIDTLQGNIRDYEQLFGSLTKISPVPVEFHDIRGETKGYYHLTERKIVLQENMSQMQTLKTLVHEIAHAMLHSLPDKISKEMNDKSRNKKEVEAESVAYSVCQYYGIDTSDYSFGYIAGWSSGRDRKELKESLETIHKTAGKLIDAIDNQLEKCSKIQKRSVLGELNSFQEECSNKKTNSIHSQNMKKSILRQKER